MSKHYMIFYTDDSNVKDWGDLTPDKVHTIKFKGKQYDEVRHGRWVDIPFTARWICSNCDYISEFASFKYCPDCGARMDLEDEE